MAAPTSCEEDYQCSICMDTLYKPCGASCGHLFCFWCLHRAMDPFRPSSCPICRSQFSHQPLICEAMHFFLEAEYPERYAERAEEVEADEKLRRIDSQRVASANPFLPAAGSGRAGAQSDASLPVLQCVKCDELACAPVVLTCGHLACGAGCRDDVLKARRCPRCRSVVAGNPRPSIQVTALLKHLVPDEYAARVAEASAREAEASSSAQLPRPEESPPQETKPEEAAAPTEEAAASTEEAEASARPPRPPGLRESFEERLRDVEQNFTWFGVGCDGCGQYPIVGRRFRCRDCPEAIGFDLCEACKEHEDLGSAPGRFNQQHKPEHVLEEQQPQLDPLHFLQAAHPELTIPALMQLIQMGLEPEDDGPAAGPPDDGQAAGPRRPEGEAPRILETPMVASVVHRRVHNPPPDTSSGEDEVDTSTDEDEVVVDAGAASTDGSEQAAQVALEAQAALAQAVSNRLEQGAPGTAADNRSESEAQEAQALEGSTGPREAAT